jgi:hypothetical protein
MAVAEPIRIPGAPLFLPITEKTPQQSAGFKEFVLANLFGYLTKRLF